MLVGETPFYAETLTGTYGNIMNHEKSLSFPEDLEPVSPEAEVCTAGLVFLNSRMTIFCVLFPSQSLIRGLLCPPERRMGSDGIDCFKEHPFFKGVDWDKIHDSKLDMLSTIMAV